MVRSGLSIVTCHYIQLCLSGDFKFTPQHVLNKILDIQDRDDSLPVDDDDDETEETEEAKHKSLLTAGKIKMQSKLSAEVSKNMTSLGSAVCFALIFTSFCFWKEKI